MRCVHCHLAPDADGTPLHRAGCPELGEDWNAGYAAAFAEAEERAEAKYAELLSLCEMFLSLTTNDGELICQIVEEVARIHVSGEKS